MTDKRTTPVHMKKIYAAAMEQAGKAPALSTVPSRLRRKWLNIYEEELHLQQKADVVAQVELANATRAAESDSVKSADVQYDGDQQAPSDIDTESPDQTGPQSAKNPVEAEFSPASLETAALGNFQLAAIGSGGAAIASSDIGGTTPRDEADTTPPTFVNASTSVDVAENTSAVVHTAAATDNAGAVTYVFAEGGGRQRQVQPQHPNRRTQLYHQS